MQFAEWHAAYRAGIDRDKWEQAGTISASIRNEVHWLAALFGGPKYGEKDWTFADDYMPTDMANERPEPDETEEHPSIGAMQQQLANKYGGG